jgi:hypothetical protein
MATTAGEMHHLSLVKMRSIKGIVAAGLVPASLTAMARQMAETQSATKNIAE